MIFQKREKRENVGRPQIDKANTTLNKYRECKKVLDDRLISNQEWFKLRHWPEAKTTRTNDPEPVSAWLFNSIMGKHADAIDNYPEPAIMPREQGDEEEAKNLTSIVPLVLELNDYPNVYSDTWWDKLIAGTCCTGVFWDPGKLNGLGDISIANVDLLNLYWEPGINDIQESSNLFYLSLVDTDKLKAQYPAADIKPERISQIKEYRHDDRIPTDNKSIVVDWYYKKRSESGKTILHFCKYTGQTVLYSTEDDPKKAESGIYDHGEYPFVIDTIFPVKGSIAGFGHLDIMKDPQIYIDKLNQALLKNACVNARPRYFVTRAAKLDVKEYANLDNDFIHISGNLNDETIKPVAASPFPSVFVTLLEEKIAELKETSGNRDVSNGGTTSGVTAASAIAAMQEASGKSSRDIISSSYRAFAEIVRLVIELIRQFYDLPRTFRILGEDGSYTYQSYDNSHLQDIATGTIPGENGEAKTMYRTPTFDIKVSAQKASAYSKISQNEMAKEFYSAGFFRPDMADQALACVKMMDFDDKDKVIQTIQSNGTLYQENMQLKQQLLALAQVVDELKPGDNVAEAIAAQIVGGGQGIPGGSSQVSVTGSQADKARAAASEVATPR